MNVVICLHKSDFESAVLELNRDDAILPLYFNPDEHNCEHFSKRLCDGVSIHRRPVCSIIIRASDSIGSISHTIDALMETLQFSFVKIMISGDKIAYKKLKNEIQKCRPEVVDMYLRFQEQFKNLNKEQKLHLLNYLPDIMSTEDTPANCQ